MEDENQLVISKDELLEDVMISYYKKRQQFYSSAKLRIDGYIVNIEAEYFETIDEAVQSIKTRISNAVIKFGSLKQ